MSEWLDSLREKIADKARGAASFGESLREKRAVEETAKMHRQRGRRPSSISTFPGAVQREVGGRKR